MIRIDHEDTITEMDYEALLQAFVALTREVLPSKLMLLISYSGITIQHVEGNLVVEAKAAISWQRVSDSLEMDSRPKWRLQIFETAGSLS